MGMCKPARRFVAEAIYGIQARQSVLLSEIARSLNEEIRLKKTETRLSNEVGRWGLGERLERNILKLGAGRIGMDTLLVVDLSDIMKRYGRRMEYLGRVRDGSRKEIGNGYETLQVVGTELDGVHITPLIHRLYSSGAPGFVSENEEILRAVRDVSREVGGRGIYVIDRGGDRRKLYYPLLGAGRRFIIRLVGVRFLEYRGKLVAARELGTRCPMYHADRVVREEGEREKSYHIEYGFMRVRLPGRKELLTLVAVRGYGGVEPILLLTNVAVARSRNSCSFVVRAYIKRWQVEETIRCMKQSYDIENVRLLTYERLRNMMVLVLCAMYFAAVHLGDSLKLAALAYHALRASKRLYGIPNFRYYAVADGIRRLLERSTRPFRMVCTPATCQTQLTLFNP